MKKLILNSLVLLLSVGVFAQEKYSASSEKSSINWKGFKPTGAHNGIIKLSKGYFTVKSGEIVGGEFTIDMNSIVNLDMPADNEYNAKLVNHLKSDDFFDTAKFPTGTFKVTGSEKKGGKTLINGTLTLKNKTNPVSFLAEVINNGNNLTVKSEIFKVDRSKYDVRYKSKSFFDDLKDKFIEDDMEISVLVEASK